MPIIGLTDRNDSVLGGLPVIAKIHKGDEKKDERRPGADLDYFRVTFEDQYAEYAPIFAELYGEQPTEFYNVFLTADTVDEAFSTWLEEWNQSGTLLHRCDGEHQVTSWSESSAMYVKAKLPCVKDGGGCACKQTGRLSVMLPDFVEATGLLGQFAISTHSINDILTVYRYLSTIERMYGKLSGVPFIFGRSKQEISAPHQQKQGSEYVRTGKRIKVTKSLFYLHVDTDFTLSRLLPAMMLAPALPASTEAPPAPIDADRTKKLLGAGQQRRIGGNVVTMKTADDDDLTTQQRNTIKNTANDFSAWCKTQQFDSALVLKALKVSRLGEFDWLQENALEVAKTAVHAYCADNQLGKTG